MKLKYSPTRRYGNKAEDLATFFLSNSGYEILSRNYLKKVGEIDIIAKKQGVFHFIEVKSVTCETTSNVIYNESFAYRVENKLNREKLLKIYKTARIFLMNHNLNDVEVQIDLITVSFYRSGEMPRLDFIENIN